MTFCIRRICRSIRWFLRSIGVATASSFIRCPIDRLAFRDRSALVLCVLRICADRSARVWRSIGKLSAFYLLFFETPADRSADNPQSIGYSSGFFFLFSFAPKCSVLCTFSSRFLYLCLNNLYTHKTHQNTLNLRELQ